MQQSRKPRASAILIISKLYLIKLMVGLFCIYYPNTPSSLTCFIVSQADQVSSTISRVVKDFGKIDVFVANAGELYRTSIIRKNKRPDTETAQGMAISKPILEQTLDEYRKQMSVNGT